ncbi:PREDICTED: uncharacterized protein LOC100635994 [Amphimedon queenslandica]|uniref:Uncharacterized protein n=1 Tax=Amphimedon queenslandica TaxID=400682 RepID=A0A1X7UCV8_AMPQE|nr:PREDICTED: uncharacterized protein LOC100635994 [Amphimedon queenslandica]|eukprot:XP_003388351.1 PREDICTED: uncharacterized protein LOC100635994 [Amphimedon queenslandica]
MITQKQYTEPSRKRRTGLCLPPLENCQKICCKKQRGMLRKSKHRASSCKKSIAQWEPSYVSTYSDDFNAKLAPIRMKVVITKETDSHLSIGGLVPNVTPEPALLRHMHFQSNYNNTYQGRKKDTKTMNTIVEEIEEEDNGKEPENSQKGGGGKKKEDEARYSLPKVFDSTKTQPRILSIFQQDYQVPYLTENLKPPSKRRPVDCYRPLPLVSQGYVMQTSYDRDYGRIKLPELEFVSPNGKLQRDKNKVQFKDSYCI